MAGFYEGTIETIIERLQKTIATFNCEWIGKCIPATEGQIKCLEKIFEKIFISIFGLWGNRKGKYRICGIFYKAILFS